MDDLLENIDVASRCNLLKKIPRNQFAPRQRTAGFGRITGSRRQDYL
jgi:hypothetical protein